MNGPKISKLTFAAIFITREREEGESSFFFLFKNYEKNLFRARKHFISGNFREKWNISRNWTRVISNEKESLYRSCNFQMSRDEARNRDANQREWTSVAQDCRIKLNVKFTITHYGEYQQFPPTPPILLRLFFFHLSSRNGYLDVEIYVVRMYQVMPPGNFIICTSRLFVEILKIVSNKSWMVSRGA